MRVLGSHRALEVRSLKAEALEVRSLKADEAKGSYYDDVDMVWCLAAALVLPPLYAVVIGVVLVGLAGAPAKDGALHCRATNTSCHVTVLAAASWMVSNVALGPMRREPRSVAGVPGGSCAADGSAVMLLQLAWWVAVAVTTVAVVAVVVGALARLSDSDASWGELLFNAEDTRLDAAEVSFAIGAAVAASYHPVWVAALIVPVAMFQRAVVVDTLIAAAERDSKTGLLNLPAWRDRVETRLHGPHAGGAVLLFDLDHFKRVNDVHGHLVGDEVIDRLVLLLTQHTRAGDLAARFGGEEFVLYAEGSHRSCHELAERIRAAVAEDPVPTAVGLVAVTVSVGVAVHRDALTLEDLLVAADAALYEAKRNGRNQVVLGDTAALRPVGAAAD